MKAVPYASPLFAATQLLKRRDRTPSPAAPTGYGPLTPGYRAEVPGAARTPSTMTDSSY